MDVLQINGIQAYGYVGVLPEERSIGQWFVVDLGLGLDLSVAGKSDRLEDTYDYSAIVAQVQDLIQTSKLQLLEAVAESIATLVLRSTQISQVTVRLTKLRPPIANFTGTVTVEITRRQSGRDDAWDMKTTRSQDRKT